MKVVPGIVLIFVLFDSTLSFLRTNLFNIGFSVAFSNGTNLDLTSVAKHEDMTRNAILSVAADVLLSTGSSSSSARLRELTIFNESSLIAAYCGTLEQPLVDNLRGAISTVSLTNADVDVTAEAQRAAAHFHSEQFQAGQNRLVEIRTRLVQQIASSNYVQAREECGRLLHGVQDFYSHTNWIENRNMDPYDVLGIPDRNPENIAGQQTRTCDNCDREGTDTYSLNMRAIGGGLMPLELYSCRSNLRSSLEQSGILTSGYYGGAQDENDRVITKPGIKCSHGSPFDSTLNMAAVGGINKDTPFDILSPHYFLYEQAVSMAERASVDILQSIRSEVNDDSKFGPFLGLSTNQDSAQVSSIAYVIDTTGSMSEELPEIQATIPVIREKLMNFTAGLECGTRARYILVPFNDPDPGILITTDSIEEFLGNISSLVADGGGTAPEPSIGATIRAVQASEPDSPVYVFTDAGASDGNRRNELQTLLGTKNTPIFFALVNINNRRKRSVDAGTGKRTRVRRTSASDLSLYEDLARFSGGQVLNVQTSDISELATQISFSAFQNPHTVLYKSGSGSLTTNTYLVPLDSSVQRALITISGTSISSVVISSPQGTNAGSVEAFSMLSSSNSRYVGEIFFNSLQFYGNWTVSFQSAAFSLDVTTARLMYIKETIYQVDNSNAYGFSVVDGMPLEGQELIVLIEADSSVTTVEVTRISLVDGSGNILTALNDVASIGSRRFAAIFQSPSVPFLFRIEGEDGNGYTFSYVTNTPIKVSSIKLSLGEGVSNIATIRPNETVNFTIVLHNEAPFGRFLLMAIPLITSPGIPTANLSEFIDYSVMSNSTSLTTNTSTSVYLVVTASNINQSVSIRFTVFAEAESNREINNYIELDVFATTIPRSNVTENIDSTASPIVTMSGSSAMLHTALPTVTMSGSRAMLPESCVNLLVYFVILVIMI